MTQARSPLARGTSDLISKDGHSALIQFTPTGSYKEAVLYIDKIVAAVDKVEARHPGFYVESAGVSTDKALDKEIQGGLAKAGMISIPLTIIILMVVLGSLVAALIPLLVALSSIAATTGLLALSSQGIPADKSIMEVILLIGLAVGVDYSLFYMRREREERQAGRSEGAALAAAAATSGRAVLVSGITVLIAMAGMFLSGDKTFMSFSVGAMLVVAVAMFASLTVLPAVLSKLGDRVEKGRIPFVHRLRRNKGEGRIWSAILDRVLAAPASSRPSRAGAVLVALAVPTLSLHTTADRHRRDHQPGSQADRADHRRLPRHAGAGRRRDQGRRRQRSHPSARRSPISSGRRSRPDEMNPPINVDTSRDGTVARGRDPARRATASTTPRPGRSRPCATRCSRARSASSTASSTP